MLSCTVCRLSPGDPAFEAAYWHNALFNPALRPDVTVLGFAPDWAASKAEPPLPG